MEKILKLIPGFVWRSLAIAFAIGYTMYVLTICYFKLTYRIFFNRLREKYNIGNKVYDTDFRLIVETCPVDEFRVSPIFVLPRDNIDAMEKDFSIMANVYITKHYIIKVRLLDKSVYFEFNGDKVIISSKIIRNKEVLYNDETYIQFQ